MAPPTSTPLPPVPASGEAVWLEVIRKMDETYADLVGHQVELEKKNHALEEARAFIDDVMGAMTDVMIVIGPRGHVRQVNRALEQAMGGEGQDLIDHPAAQLFEPACRTSLQDMLTQLKARGRIEDKSLTLQTPAGAFELAVNLSALTDRRGRHTGAVLVGRPVGELKQAYADLAEAHQELKGAQDRLVHSEKMASLGRLVAGVAHEINNPMSFVYGNVHTLHRYGERLLAYLEAVHAANPAPEARKSLKIDALLADMPAVLDAIKEGAERTRDIVESLRRYASEKVQTREEFDLVSLIYTSIRWVTKGDNPQLETRYEGPEHCVIEAHSGAIQQVLMNIVQNAIDAQIGQEKPLLDVTLEERTNSIVLRLRDHGPGIAEGDRRKLFDPFFTTKPVGRGTGLGLSISAQIMEAHDGSIAAQNDPRGGAVFTLTLPHPGGTP
ncbi:MAG: PAS domain-containing protein [Proteobacteria bacterium]|nr:PAS domain-containing protein [Pseudomonadota bacterium]